MEAVANCNNDSVLSYGVSSCELRVSFARVVLLRTSILLHELSIVFVHTLHTHGNAKLLDLGRTDDGIIDAENTNTLQSIIFYSCHA